jgi:hypothetical protein
MLASSGCFFTQLSYSLRTACLACSFDIRPPPSSLGTRAGEYGNSSLFKSRITNVASGWCDHPF